MVLPKWKNISENKIEWATFFIVFVWFAFQLFYFANKISLETFPDEPYHIAVANLWKDSSSLTIQDGQHTFKFGQISRQPYLYHATLGHLRKLVPSIGDDVAFYRNLSVLFSLAGFYFSWMFFRQVIHSAFGRIFALYFQACILSYAFISAAVSYDSLTNTLCFLAVWLFVKFRTAFTLPNLILLTTVLAAGNMVKVTFLPLTLIMLAVIGFYHGKVLLQRRFWDLSAFASIQNRLILVFFGLFVAMNLEFYGTNLVRYKQIVPECDVILSSEVCQRHYAQAKRALQLEEKSAEKPRMSFDTYLKSYFAHMENGLLMLQAHKAFAPLSDKEVKGFRSILQGALYGLLIQLIFFRRKYFSKLWFGLGFIGLSYVAVLISVNYADYVRYGEFGLGLQGRYWFPVLVPAVFLVVSPIFENMKKPLQAILFVVGLIYCQTMGFHIFKSKVNSHWFKQ